MAVKDESLHHATDNLISQNPRLYYRITLNTTHWQLRSLLSSPEKGVVYYPNGNNVYAFYPKIKEQETVAKLSFPPRCMTVAGGWLCCGGHHGSYSSINLCDDRSSNSTFAVHLGTDPDTRLPLDFEPSRHRDAQSASRISRALDYPLQATVKKIGVEEKESDDAIVNCITLWFPTSNSISDRAHKKPVAVLANNDKSVYILNLEDSEVLQRLPYPDCVNRAAISPDGDLLVAVLDDPFLYVHKRTQVLDPSPGLFSTKDTFKWAPACRIQLEGQEKSDESNMRGSFALSFSTSGKYLAVATQYGIISVFEVENLTKEDAEPLAIFTSSRPNRPPGDGAVRAIEFSPGVVDLLAWTESSGRVGVADIRNLFLSRQLLMVNNHQDGIEKIIVSERERSGGETTSSSSTTPDYLGLDFERRQLRNLTREMLDRHQSPLTSTELEILQAHRIARRQRDALNASESSSSRVSPSGLPDSIRDFVATEHRTAASFRSFINERNQDRERRNQELRTRSSAILAAAERSTETDDTANTETFTRSGPPLGNPWAEIDALYRSRYPAPSNPPERSTRVLVELEEDDRRDFAHRLRRPWQTGELGIVRDENSIILRGVLRARHDGSPERDPETMGLSWSPDGRILYVGAEDGIYEYHVNTPGRKLFPSLVLR